MKLLNNRRSMRESLRGGCGLVKKKEKSKCRVEGCERVAFCKGVCQKHYQRLWKYGEHGLLHVNKKSRGKCSECEGDAHAFGLCDKHYKYYKRRIDKVQELEMRLEKLEEEKKKLEYRDRMRGLIGGEVKDWQEKLYESEKDAREVMKELRKLTIKNRFLENKVVGLKDEIEYLRMRKKEYEESSVGQRLRKIRKLNKMSVKETIKKLNEVTGRGKVVEAHYREWEEDLGRPDLVHFIWLGRIWECSTRYLERGLIEDTRNRLIRGSKFHGNDEEAVE